MFPRHPTRIRIAPPSCDLGKDADESLAKARLETTRRAIDDPNAPRVRSKSHLFHIETIHGVAAPDGDERWLDRWAVLMSVWRYASSDFRNLDLASFQVRGEWWRDVWDDDGGLISGDDIEGRCFPQKGYETH